MALEDGARTILRSLYDDVLQPAPAVLSGRGTRDVHDMRVAIRRLRSAMGAFGMCFPNKRRRALQVRIRRLGRKLGEVRDADVQLASLRGAVGRASPAERPGVRAARDHLRAERRRALADFASALAEFDRDSLAELLA
jgi:CHAD domain-containing protein